MGYKQNGYKNLVIRAPLNDPKIQGIHQPSAPESPACLMRSGITV